MWLHGTSWHQASIVVHPSFGKWSQIFSEESALASPHHCFRTAWAVFARWLLVVRHDRFQKQQTVSYRRLWIRTSNARNRMASSMEKYQTSGGTDQKNMKYKWERVEKTQTPTNSINIYYITVALWETCFSFWRVWSVLAYLGVAWLYLRMA